MRRLDVSYHSSVQWYVITYTDSKFLGIDWKIQRFFQMLTQFLLNVPCSLNLAIQIECVKRQVFGVLCSEVVWCLLQRCVWWICLGLLYLKWSVAMFYKRSFVKYCWVSFQKMWAIFFINSKFKREWALILGTIKFCSRNLMSLFKFLPNELKYKMMFYCGDLSEFRCFVMWYSKKTSN